MLQEDLPLDEPTDEPTDEPMDEPTDELAFSALKTALSFDEDLVGPLATAGDSCLVMPVYGRESGITYTITQKILGNLREVLAQAVIRYSATKLFILNNAKVQNTAELLNTLGFTLYGEKEFRLLSCTLDGKTFYVVIHIKPKPQYTEFKVHILGESYALAQSGLASVEDRLSGLILEANIAQIEWYFVNRGEVRSTTMSEILCDKTYDEAYPRIKEGIGEYSRKYLESDESIIILKGSPGLGKTRFIRNLLREATMRKKDRGIDTLYVGYSADPEVLSYDRLFIDLLDESTDIIVLEDIDNQMGKRADGNDVMTKLLNTSDGLISNTNKKMILSTNLPNITSIDEALLRPGRCYDILEFKALSVDEAKALSLRIVETDTAPKFDIFGEDFTLAEIYKGCKAYVAGDAKSIVLEKHQPATQILHRTGFGK